jgi:hypothetical protein
LRSQQEVLGVGRALQCPQTTQQREQ